MTIDYVVEYVKEHIKEDIDGIKREYRVDISPEIGRVMKSFVSYYVNKDHEGFQLYSKFLNISHGLERYLKRKINNPVSLHETMKAGFQICRAVKDGDERALRELETYFNKLIHKELELNGHDQIFP